MGIKCPECHSDNTDTARFCSNCATPLPSQEVSVTKTLETPTRRLALGSIFAERYEILKELGKGGMGEVYRVKDETLDEEVALKLLKPEIAADKDMIERFKNELKFSRKIAHRNVCKMYDLNEEEETPYITMEYVKGEDLKSFIRRKEKLTEEEVIALAKQVCEGLAEAHGLGVVHRDLKPQNIMIDEKSNAKVMDFGIARSVEAPGVTQSGVMIGTPDYMSPEQAEGEEADHRSDIYALGVILYEMVTGSVPFKGDTAFSVALKHKTKLPSDPKKLNPEISENLSRVILICMEKARERRYQTAESLLNDLQNIEEGLPLGTKILPRRATFAQTLMRKKLLIPALAVFLAMITAAVFIVFMGTGPELDPNRIVVAIFDNQTGDPTHDPLGRMAADWISNGLAQTGHVDIVPSNSAERIYSGYEGEDPIRFLAQQTKAGTVISGSYYLQGDSVQFHAQVTDARKGKLLEALDPVSGSIEDPRIPIESLREQLMTKLAIFFEPELKDWAELMYMPSSYEAYKEYLEGRALFRKVEYKKALEHLLRAAALDPKYAQPRIWAAYAYANFGEFAKADAFIQEVDALSDQLIPYDRSELDGIKAMIRGDFYGMYRSTAQKVQLAPDILYEKGDLGELAVWINRPQEAVDLLSQVDPEAPEAKGWWPYWDGLSTAYNMLGDHKQELKAAQRGRRQYPDQLWILIYEIRALAALGKIKEVNERLDEGFNFPLRPQPDIRIFYPSADPHNMMYWARRELRAYGYKEASLQVNDRAIEWLKNRPKEEAETRRHRERVATFFWFAERWEEAQGLYEELHEEYPDSISYLGWLGTLAARLGNREEALRIAGLLENEKRPYLFGNHTYWRARIAAFLGEKELAVRLLREAHAQGVWFIRFHNDKDLEPLYDYPPYQEFMKPKG